MENKEVRVRFIGESDPLCFIHGKIYTKIGESHGYWKVIDETGEDYLYVPEVFEIVDDEKDEKK